MRKWTILWMAVMGVCLTGSLLFAQTAPTAAPDAAAVTAPADKSPDTAAAPEETTQGGDATDENLGFAFGSLKSINGNTIVVTEQDDVSGKATDTETVADAETAYEGIAGLADLKAGDVIEVVYQDLNGKKTAKMISKSDTTKEEPANSAPTGMTEPAPAAK
ncbi:MAG: hypothetical protein HQL26_01440 [Candidatus Omnitrophica bacterium]|nr:hypothetical protein [Candidatus Omnitrophota bacterium]